MELKHYIAYCSDITACATAYGENAQGEHNEPCLGMKGAMVNALQTVDGETKPYRNPSINESLRVVACRSGDESLFAPQITLFETNDFSTAVASIPALAGITAEQMPTLAGVTIS